MKSLLHFWNDPDYDDNMAFLFVLLSLFKNVVIPARANALERDIKSNKISKSQGEARLSLLRSRAHYLLKLNQKITSTNKEDFTADEWLYIEEFLNNAAISSSIRNAYCQKYNINSVSGHGMIEQMIQDLRRKLGKYIDIAKNIKEINYHADTEEQQDITDI